MLEKRSRNAMAYTPLVAKRQHVPLEPIVEGVLYGRWHGYAYTSVSRALLFASWQTLGKPYVAQTLGKPYVTQTLGKPYVEPARMRKVTLEKRLYTRTHATNHIAHPQL